MASREQNIKAGIFLLAGLILLTGIFLLVYLQRRQSLDEYTIIFKESVSGLRKDANVVYQGVQVGKVLEIKVNQDNMIESRIGIDPAKVTLYEGVAATLDIEGLMGGQIIELSGGSKEKGRLDPEKPLIAATSIMGNLAQNLPQILEEIRNILGKIDQALGEVSQAEIPTMMKNMNGLIRSTDNTLLDTRRLLEASGETLHALQREISLSLRTLRRIAIPAEQALSQVADDPAAFIRGKVVPAEPYAR